MMSRAEEERLGGDAQRLLEDPTFQWAINTLRSRYFVEFEMSTTSKERDEVHAKLKALGDISGQLTAAITTGKLAGRELARI